MSKTAEKQKNFHLYATIAWGLILVLAITGAVLQIFHVKVPALLWLLGVAFISFCSIYANMGTHFGAYQASRAEVAQQDPGVNVKKGKKK